MELERRLIDVSDRLKRLRSECAVADEQLTFLEEEADDARLRALVSETPIAAIRWLSSQNVVASVRHPVCLAYQASGSRIDCH